MDKVTAQTADSGWTAKVASICGPAPLDFPIPCCYVGVSIGHPNFQGKRLQAIVAWLRANSQKTVFVIGDDLHRWTVMLGTEVGEAEAVRLARIRGDAQFEGVARATEGIAGFSIVRWAQLKDMPLFASYLAALHNNLSDNAFHGTLIRTAEQYLSARSAAGIATVVDHATAKSLACRYIIEEIAVFCVLVSDGWPVEVYPGPELEILSAISAREISNVPAPLLQRTNVALSLTKSR